MFELERGAFEPPSANHTTQPMRLYAIDAWVGDAAVLTDTEQLRAALSAAVDAGGATVVGEAFYAFPNGAVTGVLLLAQSHLSIHTWPELRLANIDLLTCGDIDGGLVLEMIRGRLGVERVSTRCIRRSLG